MINLPRVPGGQAGRAQGALYGLAIGDALGMPTQLLSRPEIVARWGPLLTGFEPAPDEHPIAAGHQAGDITDDTEQAVLLGRLLVAGHGRIDPHALAGALVAWEADMKARGSLDLLGPSTRRALAAVQAGAPPEEAGATGDTNGAAMRIAPVGIATPLRATPFGTTPLRATSPSATSPSATSPEADNSKKPSLETLVDHVERASFVTHGTSLALAGAAAVAAAVSAGVAGAGVPGAIAAAIAAARIAAGRGRWVAG